MSNDSKEALAFVKEAALYIAQTKSLSIEDALSVVYNSETFRLIDENESGSMPLPQMLDIFKQEIVSGKVLINEIEWKD